MPTKIVHISSADIDTRDGRPYSDPRARLSNSAFHRCGGNGSGAACWWLKDDTTGAFVSIPRVRGDEALALDVELTVGHSYTVGTGRGRDALRGSFEVEDTRGDECRREATENVCRHGARPVDERCDECWRAEGGET